MILLRIAPHIRLSASSIPRFLLLNLPNFASRPLGRLTGVSQKGKEVCGALSQRTRIRVVENNVGNNGTFDSRKEEDLKKAEEKGPQRPRKRTLFIPGIGKSLNKNSNRLSVCTFPPSSYEAGWFASPHSLNQSNESYGGGGRFREKEYQTVKREGKGNQAVTEEDKENCLQQHWNMLGF